MSSEHATFSANKIFVTLFVLTAVEVGWSLLFHSSPHWIKWGGLLIFAFWKGLMIYTYFMHMKFEGWIVKALIAPTPLLVLVILFAVMPDVSFNQKLDYPVGYQLDKKGRSGQVVGLSDPVEKEGGSSGGH